MASFELDLNLESDPGTEARDAEVAGILREAGAEAVTWSVAQEHGPAGGAQVVVFEGPCPAVARVVGWAIKLMGEDPSWADEYWTDRS